MSLLHVDLIHLLFHHSLPLFRSHIININLTWTLADIPLSSLWILCHLKIHNPLLFKLICLPFHLLVSLLLLKESISELRRLFSLSYLEAHFPHHDFIHLPFDISIVFLLLWWALLENLFLVVEAKSLAFTIVHWGIMALSCLLIEILVLNLAITKKTTYFIHTSPRFVEFLDILFQNCFVVLSGGDLVKYWRKVVHWLVLINGWSSSNFFEDWVLSLVIQSVTVPAYGWYWTLSLAWCLCKSLPLSSRSWAISSWLWSMSTATACSASGSTSCSAPCIILFGCWELLVLQLSFNLLSKRPIESMSTVI